MGYVYTWNGSIDHSWSTYGNWNTVAGISPVAGTLTDTSDFTSTVTFVGGPAVGGVGSANFIYVDGAQTFSGAFSAVGQPAIGLSNYYTAFAVIGGAATFAGPGAQLTTAADVLVGYGDPGAASPASLVFSGGATATLNTNNVIDYLGNRIYEFSLYIGYDHSGSVDLEGAGTSVKTDSGVAIGLDAGVSGALHVGTGAHLEIGSSDLTFGFTVGTYGDGTLTIDGGGTVKADGAVDIGTQYGSMGVAVVDGARSDLHAFQSIYVGTPSTDPSRAADGVGSLTVSDGATVESDSSIKVFAGSTLTVTSGGSVASTGLSGAGARIQVLDGGVVKLGAGATLSAQGTNADDLLMGVQVESGGLISGIGSVVASYVTNDGTINASVYGGGGTLLIDSALAPTSDPGTPGILSISGNATLELEGGVASNETVVFNNTAQAGYHETLKIDGSPSTFHAPIQGLAAGDAIDLAGVTGATTWSLNSATDILTVENASGATLASLQLLGNYANASFSTAADGSGGYVLTESATAKAPAFTSGSGRSANYVINKGFTAISQVQASGANVQYFLKDPRTGALVSSTGAFAIDSHTGELSFTKPVGYGDYDVTVVAKNAAGQTSQNVDVDVTGPLMFGDSRGADTYVFHRGFGLDALFGFQTQSGCGGSANDVLQLDHALFSGATQGETGAALVALLQGATQQTLFGAEINSTAGDHLLLVGVSKQSLLAHASADVHIV